MAGVIRMFGMQGERNKAGDDKKSEQTHLGDGEEIADPIPFRNSPIVYRGEKSDQHRQDGGSRKRRLHSGEKFAEIGDEKVRYRGNSRDTGEPSEPSILNRKKSSERRLGVEIRSARFFELRRDFRHASGNQTDSSEGHKEPDRTQPSEPRGNQRRQTKNARANHGVDDQRHQAPAPNGSHQSA